MGDFHIFKIRADHKESPRNQHQQDFLILECPQWVNVIAVTPDEKLVMVEQFRHGTETVELEIPGGMIDGQDPNPVFAGERELREETGFVGEYSRLLGRIAPNPAIMGNTCYTVLVENCLERHELQLDHGEDIVVRLIPLRDIPSLVSAGKIQHALVIVALHYYEMHLNGLRPPT